MNSLAVVLAGVLMVFSGMLLAHHMQYTRRAAALAPTGESEIPALSKASPGFPAVMALFVVLLSVGIYQSTGRFSDWDKGVLDDNIDYLVAAEITKGRQAVDQMPDNEIALLNLAHSYMEGGMYRNAVETLDTLLTLTGEDAELMGLKATAMYYRDERAIAPETGIVIARVLALFPEEMQTRMLLANDAYFKGQYAKAIEHWQILLTNKRQAVNHRAINNAISKAQTKGEL
ncbi:nitrite reductase [Shewanella corallii]|uniref:Nitrite reductase n=1 Tax=Shewanella corallii TaxID=560080 RepID=A0ABT0N853_9GAMM|nr:tetratricopeptide repeat protein [Shewanella corallii]MCL2914624.1 nitrite reductase [Shewanella corallii]